MVQFEELRLHLLEYEDKLKELNIFDEQLWRDCNPSIGRTLRLSAIRAEAQDAKRSEAAERLFRWLRLNQWIATASVGWIPDDLRQDAVESGGRGALDGRGAAAARQALLRRRRPLQEHRPYGLRARLSAAGGAAALGGAADRVDAARRHRGARARGSLSVPRLDAGGLPARL